MMNTQAATQGAPQGATQALLDFHLFPNLPLELKHRIWKFAANFERDVVITVEETMHQTGTQHNNNTYWTFQYKSKRATPAILHTSQEARREGLRYYKLSFGTEFQYGTGCRQITVINEPSIYVNMAVDRLWLDSDDNVEYWTHFFTFGVERVAIFASSAESFPPPESWLHHPLKEITFYTGDTSPYFGDWQWVSGLAWPTTTNADIPCREKTLEPADYEKTPMVCFVNEYFAKWEDDPEYMLEEKRAIIMEELADMGATDIPFNDFVFDGDKGKDWKRPTVKLLEVI